MQLFNRDSTQSPRQNYKFCCCSCRFLYFKLYPLIILLTVKLAVQYVFPKAKLLHNGEKKKSTWRVASVSNIHHNSSSYNLRTNRLAKQFLWEVWQMFWKYWRTFLAISNVCLSVQKLLFICQESCSLFWYLKRWQVGTDEFVVTRLHGWWQVLPGAKICI